MFKRSTRCPKCNSKAKGEFCDKCGYKVSENADSLCNILRAEYPALECPHCKSKRIEFDAVDNEKAEAKNFFDAFALKIVRKYREKYPVVEPEYRVSAMCTACGHKWMADKYKGEKELLAKCKLLLISSFLFIILLSICIVSSIASPNNNNDNKEESTTPVVAEYQEESSQTETNTFETIEESTEELYEEDIEDEFFSNDFEEDEEETEDTDGEESDDFYIENEEEEEESSENDYTYSEPDTKDSNSTIVLRTATGECYHTHKCGRGTYYECTLKQAKAAGLRPCTRCY